MTYLFEDWNKGVLYVLVEIKQNTTRGWCYEGVGLVVAGAEAKQGMREGVEGSSIDNTLVYPNTPRYAATGTASKYSRTIWSIQIPPQYTGTSFNYSQILHNSKYPLILWITVCDTVLQYTH